MTDSDASREALDPEEAPDEESSPVVERRWRPADDAPFHVPASSEAEAPADASAPPPDAPPGDGDPASNPHDQAPPDSSGERVPPTDDGQSGSASPEEKATGGASVPHPSPTASDAAPKEASRSRSGHGGGEPEGPEPARTGASGETSLDADAPDGALPPQAPPDDADEAARQGSDDALTDPDSDGSWIDRVRDRPEVSLEPEEDDEGNFFTDNNRYVPGAERVEEELREFAYEINEGTANTDWNPSERADRRIASMFGRLVSKVAEDMSYQPVPGDEFWDPRKIMRRQIDRRPLQHCKMDYTKQRLALLVDTSPSCRDEAVFYSKIATGALLRDDIDIFLCPNGHIDAKFDPDPMRFVEDDRGSTWGLEGRVVLYFTDWDGTDEIVDHSRDCTLYWFDNCSPSTCWESEKDRHRRVRLQYRGRHFYCPDPEAFRRLARKIRP
jgi:hypothetical protein